MANPIETMHDDLGLLSVEEDCRACDGTGILTRHANLVIVTEGMEDVADVGFCTDCHGSGRVFWVMTVGMVADETYRQAEMVRMVDDWRKPREDDLRAKMAFGMNLPVREVG